MTDVNEFIFDTYMVCGWKCYTQVTVLTVKFPALMTCLVSNLSTLTGKQVEKLLY